MIRVQMGNEDIGAEEVDAELIQPGMHGCQALFAI
jgi:hypothetical protein